MVACIHTFSVHRKMAEEKLESMFTGIGLSEAKAKETSKNKHVSGSLVFLINQVRQFVDRYT